MKYYNQWIIEYCCEYELDNLYIVTMKYADMRRDLKWHKAQTETYDPRNKNKEQKQEYDHNRSLSI